MPVPLSFTHVRHAFRFVISLHRCLMYAHRCRGRDLPRCGSYFPPPSTLPLAFRLSSIRNHCRTYSVSSVSLLFPKPRAPLQSESHYNDFLPCLLTLSIPSGSYVCDIATRERVGTYFLLRYSPCRLISQSCVSIWDYFLLPFCFLGEGSAQA